MLDLGNRTSVYQPQQEGLKFPQDLRTNNLEELRQHRKTHLVTVCRSFARWGLDFGFASHLTIRDPDHPELYWTSPMAVHFAQVKLSNLNLVNHESEVFEGEYAVNQASFVLHAAIHTAPSDILAMCHAHTLYGATYASLGRRSRRLARTPAHSLKNMR